MITPEMLDHHFTYHAPNDVTAPKYASIREAENAVHEVFTDIRDRGHRRGRPSTLVREDCDKVNTVTRAFAEALIAHAPPSADLAAAYRCVRLARNGANEFIMANVLGYPLGVDSLRIAVDEVVKARWQGNGSIACDGK